MALDSRFILAYPFADYFVDKDTGLPLSNGVITFYKDDSRTELKNIYTLNGMPPYTTNSFIPLPNPMQLNSSGNPQDNNGNIVAIYFFPYEESINNFDSDIELYYMTCFSQNGVPQFTRGALPQLTNTSGTTGDFFENFITNPQFLAHNAAQSNGSLASGQLTQLVTNIAAGGWYFVRDINNMADIITFYRYNSPINPPPSGNPRYAVDINITSGGSGQVEHLRYRFPNVNMFSSYVGQFFTFSLCANTVAPSGDITCPIYLIRNFGTGGSPTPPFTLIGTIVIKSNSQQFSINFSMGNNSGFSLGPNDDDYIEIAIAIPPGSISRSRFTDFILTPGMVNITSFPDTTNAQQLTPAYAGNPVNDPDDPGQTLYLPVINGRNGWLFDDSDIGKVYACAYPATNLGINELLCDGSGFIYKNYSANGIPYRRLGDVLLNANDMGNFQFGTAPFFITSTLSYFDSGTIFLTTNLAGLQTITSDGSAPTGFVFSQQFAGAPTINMTGYYRKIGSTVATLVANVKGIVPDLAQDFNTNFLINTARNETNAYQIFTVDTSPGLPAAGTYFVFSTTPGLVMANKFYVWFRVNGAGVDPAPAGRTGIRIDILSTYNTTEVTRLIASAISRKQVSSIKFTAAPPASSWFTFYSNSQQYYAWFTVNGVGTDPAVTNAIGINIIVTTTMTLLQLSQSIYGTLNIYSFALPDLRGVGIRGFDPTGEWDVDTDNRLFKFPVDQRMAGINEWGTLEIDSTLHHEHPILGANTRLANGEGGIISYFAPSNAGLWNLIPQSTSGAATSGYVTPPNMSSASLQNTNSAGSDGYVYSDASGGVTGATPEEFLINQGETRGTNIALNFVIKY